MKEEIKRQLTHLTTGNFFIIALALWGWLAALKIAVVVLLGWIFLYFYTRTKGRHKYLHHFLTIFERSHEYHHPGKAPLVFLGALVLLFILFHRVDVLIGALIVLSYGDSFATIIGKKFGRIKIKSRTLEGTLGGFAIAAIILYLYFQNVEVAITTAGIGMLAEYVPIDDNYSVSIVSALTLTVLLL